MKKVISASRRTDLVAFFPKWLAKALREENVRVVGPSGYAFNADLNPENIHTLVFWSKNYSNLINNSEGLLNLVKKYSQIYFHFTISGLGGTLIEPGAPSPHSAITQLDCLLEIAGLPERISVRYDPVLFWKESGKVKNNLDFFEKLAVELNSRGIKDVRFSFAQWYKKAQRRAKINNFVYYDPLLEEKLKYTLYLVEIAVHRQIQLFSCSQDFLTALPGVLASACIDGSRLSQLHPHGESCSENKDRSQREECRCTRSIDIGSYQQKCPDVCIYCYASS